MGRFQPCARCLFPFPNYKMAELQKTITVSVEGGRDATLEATYDKVEGHIELRLFGPFEGATCRLPWPWPEEIDEEQVAWANAFLGAFGGDNVSDIDSEEEGESGTPDEDSI